MTRRALLQGWLVLWSEARAALRHLVDWLGSPSKSSPSDAVASAAKLTAADIDTLLALAEVAARGRAFSLDERRAVSDEIGYWARQSADQRDYYHIAVRLLDRLARRPFARLRLDDRIQLVDRYRLNVRAVPPAEDPVSAGRDARIVRERVVPNLIEAYWGSAAGWVALQYMTFPGRCGDLVQYTRSDA